MDSPVSLLSDSQEARLLGRLRVKLLRSVFVEAIARGRLRAAMVAGLSFIFWLSIFAVFWEGFYLVHQTIGDEALRIQIAHAIFNLFFLALSVMLAFSSAVVFYGLVYRSDEVTLLLTFPLRAKHLVLYKFQEAAAVSCWAFLLLSTPMLLAYGIVAGAPWYYFILTLPFTMFFALISAASGAILCLVVIRYLPMARVHAVVLVLVVVVGGTIAWGWWVVGGSGHDLGSVAWFGGALRRVEYSQQQLLPSWWLSSGLLESAHPASSSDGGASWRESLGFLALLSSNALVLHILAGWVGGHLFVPGYNRVAAASVRTRRARTAWMDLALMHAAVGVPPRMRLLLVKDFRLFRREPAQWSQFLIFFGLLVLYFLNMRKFQYGQTLLVWVNAVGFLNVGVVGLILSTFTTRFIFPMISLEGRRFWILGSLPVAREEILWSKFLFAFGVSLIPCGTLIVLSDMVLAIAYHTPLMAVLHQLTCWVFSSGLAAIAVGMGARHPNLRESSAAKIASGFGGTLTLVLSALFVVVVTASTAIPSCFWVGQTHGWSPVRMGPGGIFAGQVGSTLLMILGASATVLVGMGVTVVALRAGFRAMRDLEC